MDDFGTGRSPLSCLKRLPLDMITIDRGFICDLKVAADVVRLVGIIIRMAHGLRLDWWAKA